MFVLFDGTTGQRLASRVDGVLFSLFKPTMVWYVFWYVENKNAPEGAYLLGNWRKR